MGEMRTTLNLDEDVARPLAEMARRTHRSLSRVANNLLRAGIQASNKDSNLPPYVPKVFDTGEPLVDVTDVGEALDLLERG